MKLHITTPLPPSLNNLYTNGRGHGRRVLTAEGRRYKAAVGLLIRASGIPSLDWSDAQRLSLHLILYFPDRRRTDISNRVKVLEDVLSETLGFDDCRIDRLVVERGSIDKEHPRCDVRLTTL